MGLKELINKCIEYSKDHLALTVILLAAVVLALFVTLLLICFAIKNKKTRARLKKYEAEKLAAGAIPSAPAVTVKKEPVAEQVEVKAEEPVIEQVEVKTEEPVIEQVEVKTEEPVIEQVEVKTEEPVIEQVEVKAEEPVVEQVEVKTEEPVIEQVGEKIMQPKPKSKQVKTPAKEEKSEKTGLLDELKDVLDTIDFYEESETDRAAKHNGEWTICRVVTEDNAESEEEMYFFELYAANGEKLFSSEEYPSYASALRGIQTHKKNILKGNFKVTLSKKGDYIFKLLSGKNLLLCISENYPTKARCENAIKSIKQFAKTAVLDENIQDQVVKIPPEDNDVEPLPDGYNGKWIISDTKNAEGEQVFYFELFADNGEKLLSGEEYTTYIGAINGIETYKNNISKGNFRIHLTKRGDYIYKLLNANGQLLCLGEHYKTKRRCLNAVESIKRFAANSPLLVSPYLTK